MQAKKYFFARTVKKNLKLIIYFNKYTNSLVAVNNVKEKKELSKIFSLKKTPI